MSENIKMLVAAIMVAATITISTAKMLEIGPFETLYRHAYTIEYTVKRGETLWEIASVYYKLQDKGDVRDFIDDIRKYNSIGVYDHVQPNQVLKIPVFKKR